MNKQELDTRTGLDSTPEEFAAIEAVYMTAPDMDKDAAARLYKKIFGKAARARAAEYNRPATGEELRDALFVALKGFFPRHLCVRVRARSYRFDGCRDFDGYVNEYGCREILAVDVAAGTEKTRWIGNFWTRGVYSGGMAICDDYKKLLRD